MKKVLILAGLFLVALLPILFGIFHAGFFLTDDGNWWVIRLSAFYEALRHGQFPVRFLPRLNNGFGYPVADFNYPLFLYLGSFIHIFRINFYNSIKTIFGISIFLSSFGSFLWLQKRFGTIAGFIGSLVYTLLPYHVLDITQRGSIGEALAFGVIPFAFWSIDTDNPLLTALTIALLILSHNTLALFFFPIILAYSFLEKKSRQGIISALLGLGMSAFFWMPALFDMQYTVFSKTVVANFTSYFLSSDLYPQIGIISFFVLLFSLSRIYKKVSITTTFFLIVALLSIALTNKVSQPFWDIVRLGKYIQYPFRILAITTLCVGFLSAYVVSVQKKYSIFVAIIILGLLYISSWQFFFAKSYQMLPDTYYSTNESTSTIHDEYMPIWVKGHLRSTNTKVVSQKASISNIQDVGSAITFTTNATMSSEITIEKIYFPGWFVSVDSQSLTAHPSSTGLVAFSVPQGVHHVKVLFGETPFRLFADSISVISIVLLAALYFMKKKGIIHV